ncbi:MAG: EAL domain-containing protein [Nitrospirae bacterium]|nr:EAL domain-containing protein [Nitrospirota bacterium]
MKIFNRYRTKLLVIIGISLAALILTILIASRLILLNSFLQIENGNVKKNLEQVLNALNGEVNHIDTVNADYSAWDDSYKFIQDGNRAYINDNLPDSVLSTLGLNLIVYVSSKGDVVYKRWAGSLEKVSGNVPDSLIVHLSPENQLVRHSDTNSKVTGLLRLPEGILMISSRPIIQNDHTGPVQGALIMGRLLDSEEVKLLSRLTKLSINFQRTDSRELPDDFKTALTGITNSSPFLVTSVNTDIIAGYSAINDIYGKRVLLLKVDEPRNIYQQGVRTITYFILWFAIAALAFTAISYILFERLVMSRRKGHDSEAKYRAVIEHATEGIIIVNNADKVILEGNDAFKKLLDYSDDEILEMSLFDVVAEDTGTADLEIGRIVGEKRDLKLRRKDGSLIYAELSASVLSYNDREALCVIVHDITERKLFEEQLMDQATHDSLTGLANRNLLNDRLSHAISYQKRKKMLLAVMLLDIDRFKVINDTLGHSIGDKMLQQVAERLSYSVRNYDTVARLSGDEFVIVVNDVSDATDIVTVAKNILNLFTSSLKIHDNELFIGASIGISIFPYDGDSVEHLLMKADTAMYHCKADGGNNYQFFSKDMNVKAKDRLNMETDLRKAVEQQEFILHYQPKVDLSTGEVCGMEALIRWQRGGKMISPVEFIPLAEETGLILKIGEWVLRTACSDIRKLIDMGYTNLIVSSNLSARQFAKDNLLEIIEAVLEESGLDPSFVELELTESILMKDEEKLLKKLCAVKDRGIRLSIDDFGTGYSSLSYLKRFPIDVLKIDRSFVMDITADDDGAAIVETILGMAQTMRLRSVAEGVERAEELSFLTEHGCNEIQGFYFSRPVPFDEFANMLSSGKRLQNGSIVS